GDTGDDAAEGAGTAAVSKGGIVPDAGDDDNGSTASAQLPDTSAEPSPRPAHPSLHRPVPLQQAPLTDQEAPWSAISRQVRIPTGATQPVDPATTVPSGGNS